MTEDVEAFLSSLPAEVERIARALRDRIRELVPEAVEKRHGGWKIVGYSWDGSMNSSICAIAPHSRHVNLQLFHGAGLEDPDDLLEGTGQSARHLKLRSVSDVARPGVGRLIERAAAAARGE